MSYVQINSPAKQSRWRRLAPRLVRHAVMAFFFVFLLHVAWEHQLKGGGPNGSPSVEAYCPFGGIESLYQFITTGGYIRRIEPSALLLAGAVLLLTLIFSRGFCGWICPFGSLQEWLGLLGKRIFKRRYNPTGPWERRLRYLKYVVLGVIVVFTWHLGVLVFRPFDPFLAFFHLGAGFDEMPWAYAVLGVVLIGSLKYERFFCKYACPLGAVIGLVGKIGLTKVTRTDKGCKSCNLCQKTCFAHIDFLSTNEIRDAECNHCLECVAVCPKPNVLRLSGARLSFSAVHYGVALVVGLLVTIGASQALGYWRTKPAAVAFTDLAGKADPEQIRGWMTLGEISKGYDVPLDGLYAKAGLPPTVAPGTRLNQVAKTYKLEFEPDKLREIVREMIASPAASVAQASAAPKPAPNPKPAGAAKKGDPKQHSGGEEPEVKGMMTLNEIALKTGVPKDWLVEALNLPPTVDPRVPVREWMHAEGHSIGDLRDAVAGYRARVKPPRR
jgi:hypothetical protein